MTRPATKEQMHDAMQRALALEATAQEATGPMEARAHELIAQGRELEAKAVMAAADTIVADAAEAMADALREGLASRPRSM